MTTLRGKVGDWKERTSACYGIHTSPPFIDDIAVLQANRSKANNLHENRLLRYHHIAHTSLSPYNANTSHIFHHSDCAQRIPIPDRFLRMHNIFRYLLLP